MKAIERIRKRVFGLTQDEFGAVAGVTQPTISRWESGEFGPSIEEMTRIRKAALDRGHLWNDAWFFEGPPAEQVAEAQP